LHRWGGAAIAVQCSFEKSLQIVRGSFAIKSSYVCGFGYHFHNAIAEFDFDLEGLLVVVAGLFKLAQFLTSQSPNIQQIQPQLTQESLNDRIICKKPELSSGSKGLKAIALLGRFLE
jgi:hypothetical protein